MNSKDEKRAELEQAKPIQYKENYSVIQANDLVRSRQDELSLLEAKIIRLAIAQVLKEDTDLKTYKVNITRLAEFLNISSQNIYRDIQNIGDSLLKKIIRIKKRDIYGNETKNYEKFHWIDYISYKDGEITLKLSEHLKPYLVGLDELFTSYKYAEIIKLPTNYAIRLYELLISYTNIQYRQGNQVFTYGNIPIEKNQAIFTIEYLREYFNCEDKYPNTSDFVKRVISSAIEDINQNTVFPCSYRLIKEHKKIRYVVFKMSDWDGEAGAVILGNILLKQGGANGR